MRVLILQFGYYAEAYRRLLAGGPETFRDQLHTVLFVASLASYNQVTIVAGCDRCHDEELAPGLRAIGIPRDMVWDSKRLWPLLDRLAPELFICGGPNRIPLAWAAQKRVTILPIFADVFTDKGLRNRLKNWRLGLVVRRCKKPCVANHSLSASQSLRCIGLSLDEIVPWEHQRMEPMGEAKGAPPPDRPFRLFFAGWLSESKGVGDCIEAVAIARSAAFAGRSYAGGAGQRRPVDCAGAAARCRGVGAPARRDSRGKGTQRNAGKRRGDRGVTTRLRGRPAEHDIRGARLPQSADCVGSSRVRSAAPA